MTTNRYRSFLGLALAAVAVFSIVESVYGQEKSAPAQAMPGMDMSTPAPKPATAAGADTAAAPGMAPDMKMPSSPNPASANGAAPPGYAPIRVSPEVQQRIGVTLGRVERTPLIMTTRTVGVLQPNETKIAHIHVKTEGWVEKLYISYTGQKVKAGEPLLSIYSPAFFVAQREYLSALQAAKSGLDQMADQQIVVETARLRLGLWDIPKDEIDALETTGEARKALTLRSPISGTVLEKQAFAGQYVMPQSDLYVVADLSTVWMQAKVFEYELPHVALGMPVTVSFPSQPTQQLAGRIVFIDPVVDEMSRSVQVRIELPNSAGQLRPGTFGDVLIAHSMGSGLTVPASAIIRTGERDIAFRAIGADRFVPVEVKINPLAFGDRFQVIDGLNAGDEVVTSANFLIDSESRLEAGASSMAGMPGMGGGDKNGGK
jgi:Cu(I)/Ag(I) efflux system membrane fusion protein